MKTILILCIFLFSLFLSAEENFLLLDVQSGKIIREMGSYMDERITPCSTFKIALSLMGYDLEILEDAVRPEWSHVKGYTHNSERWDLVQTPQRWIKQSCIWYSQMLSEKIGLEKIQDYLQAFAYGNQDFSVDAAKNNGLTHAWLSSSLKISPREQVSFLQKLVKEELPLSKHAMQLTKQLLFIEKWKDWKLFGKTGLGDLENLEVGWFIGWLENEEKTFVFAYSVRDQKTDPALRILRVKQLLDETKILSEARE